MNKELEEEFNTIFPEDWTERGISRLALKKWVDKAITQNNKEIIESLEGLKFEICTNDMHDAHNDGVDRAIRIIKNKQNGYIG